MSLVRLTIKGISYSQTQNGAYALLLSEADGERQLPIVIGAFEAQSIAIALEKDIRPPRPLTHDLFKSFAERFSITVKQVIIHKLVDGVFYSSLICERDKIEEIIDARTSDAIALALRFNAPIFTYKNILDKAGIFLKNTDTPSEEEEKEIKKTELIIEDVLKESSEPSASAKPSPTKSLEQLEDELEEAVNNEDYEQAAKLRDEISKRK
ncbi:bifunctional nuclease family protein [Mesonia aestuariivivens]|uniref:Bifunctional nuclease family protein n=1 Tax=Mesonia aestuariivivens TaxID=2796128 RepID=A0ABS6W342_9FLAO|nr:bifunctional nuclease family protein [Mesonia aestuariivivens]MBW2962134.1 bifunctional nuclease family protein [Mesonia aestuariivivens]